ncbi:MAG: hypothetical protein WDO18_05170 [Acidobacteriota bacterium]
MRFLLVFLIAAAASAQQSFAPVVAAADGQVLYGTFSSTLLRSYDGGSTWTPIYVTEAGLPQPTPVAFGVDPVNPAILYLVTSSANGFFYKSTDGGVTWNKSNSGIPANAATPSFFRVRATTSTILYLRSGDALYTSTNQGNSWTLQGQIPTSNRALEISTSDPNRLYHVDSALGVFASADGGRTWLRTATIPSPLTTSRGPSGVGILHSDPNYVLVGVGGCCEIGGQGTHRSTDGGRIFGSQAEPAPFVTMYTGPGPQIYATSQAVGGFYASKDNGATWKNFFNIPTIGVTNLAAVDARNRAIIYGSSSGPVRSTDAGDNWTRINATVTPTLAKPLSTLQITLEEGAPYRQPFIVTTLENTSWVTPLSFTITGAPWLSLSSSSGNTPINVGLTINTAGLVPAVYNGSIKIDAPQTANKSVTLPVQLTIVARGSLGPRYTLSTVAGSGNTGSTTGSGPALLTPIGRTKGIALDSQNRLVFSGGSRIWRLTDSNLETLAGNGTATSTGDNGPALQATVNAPDAIVIDAQDQIYFSERSPSKIRRISNGQIANVLDSTKSSNFFATQGFDIDANGQFIVTADLTVAKYNGQTYTELVDQSNFKIPVSSPAGLAIGPNGDYFVSNQSPDQILRITPAGVATIYAGIGTPGFSGDGGPATSAQVNDPAGLVFDPQGTLFFVDQGNSRIRSITPDGTIRTIAGSGLSGFAGDGLTGPFAGFGVPTGIAIDRSGNLYVSDTFSERIRKLTKETVPAPKPAALLHGASGSPKLAPGGLFSLYGELLSNTTKITGSTPWPRTIDSVAVTINGVAAPLYYVSPSQINGQIPYETALGTATALVSVNGSDPISIQFQVVAANPGILVYNGTRAVAVNPNGSVNAQNAPAKPGDVELLYFSGIGVPDVTVATGEGSPSDPLARAKYQYQIKLNGQVVDVAYLGLAPTFPALCQANFTIPNLPAGEYELVMVINGEESNKTILTIGN